jgi:hypothetical protein
MNNSDSWLQYVSSKLSANGFSPLPPEIYRPQGYKYAVQRSQFEISKFGMADRFFTFAEIPNLTPAVMSQFSAISFKFANKNKKVSLPNGIFSFTLCFAVAITENLSKETAEFIANTTPPPHWASNEMRVAIDLTNGNLAYFINTPLWGAAYYAGFRRMIEANLRV